MRIHFNNSGFPILLFGIIICFFACKEEEEKKILIGTWNGLQWTVNGNPSDYDPLQASFTFQENGKYSFTYSGNTERGDYFLSNNELFTTPEDGIKMMVKLPRITRDTLVMDMNRGGQAENWYWSDKTNISLKFPAPLFTCIHLFGTGLIHSDRFGTKSVI